MSADTTRVYDFMIIFSGFDTQSFQPVKYSRQNFKKNYSKIYQKRTVACGSVAYW